MKAIILNILILVSFLSYSQKADSVFQETKDDIAYAITELDANEFEMADFSISTIFTGTDDIFNANAGYVFGPARFQNRGLGSGNTRNYVNGVNVNGVERNMGAWFLWSGLNDATRNKEAQNSTQFNRYTLADAGGSFNINTRASSFAPGTKLTYSSSNRSYTNRLMFLYSTGEMSNGWAITASGSRRWADEGYNSFLTDAFDLDYTKGTNYDAWSYFLSVEKRINENHSINFTAMGAPSEKGGRNGVTQEIYDVMGTHYFNPYWGYQNGEVRNYSMRTSHQPLFILNHYWDFDKYTQLKTTAFNWRNTNDPKPNYYKHWPNYIKGGQSPDTREQLIEDYGKNPSLASVHWDDFYNINENVAKDVNGKRAVYILEGRNEYKDELNISSVLNQEFENLKLNSGVQGRFYKGNHYNTIEDLMGADYWVDIDIFAEREYRYAGLTVDDVKNDWDYSKSPKVQNNMLDSDPIVKEGDKFDHNYDANVNSYEAWSQAEYEFDKNLTLGLGGRFGAVQMWRKGYTQKGLFKDYSLGESTKENFIELSGKLSAFYKISGQHQFELNASYHQDAPDFKNVFVAARKHNYAIENPKEIKTLSTDLSYHISTPFVKGRITAYYSKTLDEAKVGSMYSDENRVFTAFVVDGLNTQRYGVEYGVEFALTDALKLNIFGAYGKHTYTDNADFTIYKDDEFKKLIEAETYMKDINLSNGPQMVNSIGLKYWSPDYWFAGFNLNHFAQSFVSASYYRKASWVANNPDNKGIKDDLLSQEELDAAFTLDMFIGKSWKIDDYYVNLSLNMSNMLNNTDFKTGGYEQWRFDEKAPEKFKPIYYYYQGFNYFLNLQLRF